MFDLNAFDYKLLAFELNLIQSSIVTRVRTFGFMNLALFHNIQNLYVCLEKAPSRSDHNHLITHRSMFNFQLECLFEL